MSQEDAKILEIISPCRSPLVLLGHLVLWTVILFALYAHLNRRKRKYSTSSSSAIAGPQLSLFSAIGIFGAFPSHSTRKKLSFPAAAYQHQTMAGITEMYRKEKIICLNTVLWNLIFLTKAESVEEFMKSNVPSTKPYPHVMTPFFGSGLFLSTGQKWKTRRKVFSLVFHSDIIKHFIPIIDKESKVLVKNFNSRRGEGGTDIVRLVSFCAMDIICATFLGFNSEAQKKKDSQFLNVMERVVRTIGKRLVLPCYRIDAIFMMTAIGKQLKKDMEFLRSYSTKIINERVAENSDANRMKEDSKKKKNDFLEVFLEFQRNNPEVKHEDVRDEVLSVIFAGQDTTSVALTWALYLIGLHPEVQRKIHEELDDVFEDDIDRPVTEDDLKRLSYVECVVKESQRLYPSVPHNIKLVLEDVVLCGYKIKKGSLVSIDCYGLHRDTDVFPNPEVFNPDRFLPANSRGRDPYAYIPFSGGMKSCLGQRFAMNEMKIIVANVLRYFSLKSLEHRDKIGIACDLLLRPAHPIKMEFIPRRIA